MDLNYWAATDVGRKRSDNEDNFLIDRKLRLFVVADGMGGHASGEIASAVAVQTVREVVSSEAELFENPRDDDVAWHLEVCILLEHAVHTACERIWNKALQEPEKRGMGTTLVVLLIAGTRGYIAYVADSRLYLVRGEVTYQLTEDHSLMNELIRRGKVRADEFEDSPYANYKNAMTRAVGPTETVEVDTLDFDMVPGDAFLLCTDGLYEYLEDDDISKLLTLPDVEEVPGRLIDIANRRGGKDNITAIVVQVARDGSAEAAAAELNHTLDVLRGVPLFADLSYPQMVRLMNMGRITSLSRAQVICQQGEPADALHVVLRGKVELTSESTVLGSLGPGDHFGEMSLIDAQPHSATVTCTSDAKTITIARREFDQILERDAPLAVRLLRRFVRELSARLRKTNAALSEAKSEVIEDLSEDLAEELEMLDAPEKLRAGPPGSTEVPRRRSAIRTMTIEPDTLDLPRAEDEDAGEESGEAAES